MARQQLACVHVATIRRKQHFASIEEMEEEGHLISTNSHLSYSVQCCCGPQGRLSLYSASSGAACFPGLSIYRLRMANNSAHLHF
jgi:hypothetical protein